MTDTATLAKLRQELYFSTEDLLVELFIIDCLAESQRKDEWNEDILSCTLRRTDDFLKQGTDDIYHIGQLLMRRIEEEAASV